MLSGVHWNKCWLSFIQRDPITRRFLSKLLPPLRPRKSKSHKASKTQPLRNKEQLRHRERLAFGYQQANIIHSPTRRLRSTEETESQSHSVSHRPYTPKGQSFCFTFASLPTQAGSCPQESTGWWMDCLLTDGGQPWLLSHWGASSPEPNPRIGPPCSGRNRCGDFRKDSCISAQVEEISLRSTRSWPISLTSHLWNGDNNRPTLYSVVKIKYINIYRYWKVLGPK